MTAKQVEQVKKHLNLVFKHEIDPSMGDEDHQDELNKIHTKLKQVGEKADEAIKEAKRPKFSHRDTLIRC